MLLGTLLTEPKGMTHVPVLYFDREKRRWEEDDIPIDGYGFGMNAAAALYLDLLNHV